MQTGSIPHPMKIPAIFLLAFLLLAAAGCRPEQVASESAPVVVLSDSAGKYPLGLHLEILEDPGGQLTIDDVTSAAHAGRFVPSQSALPDFGYTDSAYWVRFAVQNKASRMTDWRVEVNFANMGAVDFYRPMPSGAAVELVQTGRSRPAASRDIVHQRFVFALPLSLQASEVVYLRFASEAAMNLTLTLWSRPAFEQQSNVEQLGLGMFYGIMLAMLLYNLFLLVSSIQETSYLWYCLFIGSAILYESWFDGLGSLYLWPNRHSWNLFIGLLSVSLMMVFLLRFTMVFLQTESHTSRLHHSLLLVAVAWALPLLLMPFSSAGFVLRFTLFGILVTITLVMAAALFVWRRGYRPAGFFLLGWLLFFLAALAYVLGRLHLLPITPWTEQIVRPGMVGVMLLSSLALADRIKLLKAEAAQAGQRLRENERQLAQFMEALPVAVLICDDQGKVFHANQQARQLTGIAGEALQIGQSLAEVLEGTSRYLAGTNEAYPTDKLPLLRALRGETATIDDLEIGPGSTRTPLLVTGSPILDEQSQVQYAIIVFQDISERKQAEAQRQNIAHQRQQLLEFSQALLAALTLNRSLTLTQAALARSIPHEFFTPYWWDEASSTLYPLAAGESDWSGTVYRKGWVVPLDKGILVSAAQGRQAELVNNAHLDPRSFYPSDQPDEMRHEHLMALPLWGREKMIGVVALSRLTLPPYTAEEFELAQLFASQAAIAIENARLFAEMSESLDRERYLRKAAHTLSGSLELPDIFANLMQVAAGVVGAEGGLLSLVSADGAALHVVQSLNMPEDMILRPLGQGDKGLSWRVYATGEPVLLAEYRDHPDALTPLVEAGVHALIIVPISAGESRLGVLGVFTFDPQKHFNQHDLALTETIGRQVGLAIRNARLFQAEQQARQVAETLRAANLALSQSLDTDRILAILLDYLGRLIHYDSASVMLLEEGERLVIRASQGYERWRSNGDNPPLGLAMDIMSTPNLQQLLATGQSFVIEDTATYPGWVDLAGQGYIRSWLGVPLIASGRIIGLYSIDKAEPGYFTAEHVQLAEALAIQAALSIQNALLYEAEREQYNRLQISQAQLVQAEKMSALGRLSASIAHEINNPLQAIQGCLTLLEKSLRKEGPGEKVDRYLVIVSGEIERIAVIVRRMRGFYQPSPEDWRPTDIAAVLDSVLELSAKQLQDSHIAVEWTPTNGLPAVWANVNNLKQVFLNLILNALDAMPAGGKLRLATGRDEMVAKHKTEVVAAVRIEISDTGVGMPSEVASRIFEPFYTTKAQGSGLGLAISYGIIEAHGGQISVSSRQGEGTTFTILLPAKQ